MIYEKKKIMMKKMERDLQGAKFSKIRLVLGQQTAQMASWKEMIFKYIYVYNNYTQR